MSLDELIAKLSGLRGESYERGQMKVFVTAPVVEVHCWLHAEDIVVSQDEANGGKPTVILNGGFGA